jgi:hypothetical protein
MEETCNHGITILEILFDVRKQIKRVPSEFLRPVIKADKLSLSWAYMPRLQMAAVTTCNLEDGILAISVVDEICCVRVSGYRSRGPGSIPGATRFSQK